MLLKRTAEDHIEMALTDTRVVAIQGARQTGKTTLLNKFASTHNAKYVTLDDQAQREAAIHDPGSFVKQAPNKLLVIDEVQRAPALVLAIKEVVDMNRQPGQFLLTGSSDLTRGSSIEDSLAGRIEIIDLMGLSMIERNNGKGLFAQAISMPKPLDTLTSSKYTMYRQDYLALALEGGYPEAIARNDKARRDKWFDNYTKQLLRKDVGEENRLRRAHILPKLFKYLASVSGKPAISSNIAADIGEPRTTVEEYINILEAVFLVDRIPAWSNSATTRATKHPKLMFRDSGLLCRQLAAKIDLPTDMTSSISGGVFETFVYSELAKLTAVGSKDMTLYHYRDTQKKEVDFVFWHGDGALTLLEVKLSSAVTVSDFKNMEYLREKCKNVRNCFVIYTGLHAIAFSDHQFAIPAQAIWS